MKRIVSRELVIVMTILGLGVLAAAILQPILPLYLTSIGVVPTVLGLMFSVVMAGMTIGDIFGGWLADIVGIKTPLSVGTFVGALAVFSLVLTQNIPAIFLILFFWGIVRSAFYGPIRGYIGAAAPPLKKATFMASIFVVMSASRSLGALPSGFIVDTWGYHWIFFISSGIALLGGLAVVIGLRKIRLVKPKPPAVSPSLADKPPSPDQRMSYRSLAPQGTVAALQFFGLGISMTFLPLLATQVVGVGAAEVGILFTIRGLVTMVLGIPLGILADRKGKRLLMILGLLVSASGMAGIAFAESFAWLILFVIICTLGGAMFNPAALALLSNSIPLQRQSTAMGIYGGVYEGTGIIAGSALGGFIWTAWGPRVTFLVGAVAASLGAITCFGFVKEKAGMQSSGPD